MTLIRITVLLLLPLLTFGQKAGEIDLSHWKLELPTGYTASEWKLSNFQKDKFAKPFFYLDPTNGSLVMEAYPSPGKSKAKYTKNTLREQMEPGSSSKNWTMQEGGTLTAEFQVTEMSKETSKKYHRTLLFEVQGRSTKEQNEKMDREKSISMPLLKVYWQNERIRIQRKVLEDESTSGNDLLEKSAWKDDSGRYFKGTVSFEKANIKIVVSDGRVEVHLNDLKPIVYRDTSTRKWPFENYFNAGNYLQTKEPGSKAVVKFYQLEVTH
ncbi:polysaccharide lyase family 7 protein [Fulvivirga sp. M361]|uniref:polysaccharide lyase family 7 protein n=1 Tax=Fulvivirga sp. M361 TaxID=2594266 RepID=UPI00117A5803|nr:polysaccharide lyase family 7 protein [Fulvivirga sp. M361]TRX59523.1 polysaccharide lyase family 7 protein [Fulvivirga sp. M361]